MRDKGLVSSEASLPAFLRPKEDDDAFEILENELFSANEETNSDEESEECQAELDHESQASESNETATKESDEKDRKYSAESNEIAGEPSVLPSSNLDPQHEKYEDTLEELRSGLRKLTFDRCETIFKQLGGKVRPGRGSHYSILDNGSTIGGVVKPHGSKSNSWPGPNTIKDFIRIAEKLIEQSQLSMSNG